MSEGLVLGAVAVCVLCSLICTVVVVVLWSQQRPTELARKMEAGDAAVRQHLDQELRDMGTQLEDVQSEVSDVRELLGRMEERQQAQGKHALQRSDLEHLYSKTNRLAESQAEMRGELTEVARMLREQLRILQTAHHRSAT